METIYKKYIKNIILIWSGCLVLFILAYLFIIIPQKEAWKQIDEKFAEAGKTYEMAKNLTKEEGRNRLNQQLEELRENAKSWVIDRDSAALTFEIKKIADDKKLGSFSNKTKNNVEIPGSKYICEHNIYVTFTSGFNHFAEFINALERYRPVIFVDKFFITRSKDNNAGHEVSASLAVFVVKN